MGMTLAEKILAAKAGKDQVKPGDLVEVCTDAGAMFLQSTCGPCLGAQGGTKSVDVNKLVEVAA